MKKYKKSFLSWFKITFNLNTSLSWTKKFLLLLVCYAVIIFIDQMTKNFIFSTQNYLNNQGNYYDFKLFGFRPTKNTGAAFGSFAGKIAFLQTIGILTVVVSTLVGFLWVPRSMVAPVFLIGAGGLGNVLDRFIFHYVRDMIYFPWWPKYPTFNFADLTVVASVVSLIIIIFVHNKHHHPKLPSQQPIGKNA